MGDGGKEIADQTLRVPSKSPVAMRDEEPPIPPARHFIGSFRSNCERIQSMGDELSEYERDEGQGGMERKGVVTLVRWIGCHHGKCRKSEGNG